MDTPTTHTAIRAATNVPEGSPRPRIGYQGRTPVLSDAERLIFWNLADNVGWDAARTYREACLILPTTTA